MAVLKAFKDEGIEALSIASGHTAIDVNAQRV